MSSSSTTRAVRHNKIETLYTALYKLPDSCTSCCRWNVPTTSALEGSLIPSINNGSKRTIAGAQVTTTASHHPFLPRFLVSLSSSSHCRPDSSIPTSDSVFFAINLCAAANPFSSTFSPYLSALSTCSLHSNPTCNHIGGSRPLSCTAPVNHRTNTPVTSSTCILLSASVPSGSRPATRCQKRVVICFSKVCHLTSKLLSRGKQPTTIQLSEIICAHIPSASSVSAPPKFTSVSPQYSLLTLVTEFACLDGNDDRMRCSGRRSSTWNRFTLQGKRRPGGRRIVLLRNKTS